MKYDEDDAPELTKEVLAKARPAKDVLPEKVMAAFKRSPGRPKAERRKTQVTLRIDPDALDHFKAGGPGWQSRINAVLVEAARRG